MRQEALYIAVFEQAQEEGYAVEALCELVNLNRSSYYKWTRREKSA